MKLLNYVFIFTLMAFSLAITNVSAQTKPNAPKDGFEMALSAQKINLKAGETQIITAELIRSKRFSKTNIELSTNTSSDALEIKIAPSSKQADLYDITVCANPGITEGNYTFTLMGKSSFLNKGKLLDVVVEGKAKNTDRENK